MLIKNIIIAIVYALLFIFSGAVNWPFQLCAVCLATLLVSYIYLKKGELLKLLVVVSPAYLIYSFDSIHNQLIHVYPIIIMPPVIIIIAYWLCKQKLINLKIAFLLLALLFTVPCYYGMAYWVVFEANIKHKSDIGKVLPDLNFRTANNEVFEFGKNTDTVIVLDFWSASCGICLREFPDFKALSKKYIDKPVKFYTVNIPFKRDSIHKTIKLIEKHFDYNLFLSDSADADKLNINSFPVYMVIRGNEIKHKGHLPVLGNAMVYDLEDEIDKELSNH